MRKFLSLMMAAVFAAATVNAIAQDKKGKDEPKKEASKKDDKKSK